MANDPKGGAGGDKPKADFSNVWSSSSSTAPAPQTPAGTPVPPPESEAKVHEVQKGESLWKIAAHYYGDGNQWRKIHEANRDVIKNPDVIHPGQKLKIPHPEA